MSVDPAGDEERQGRAADEVGPDDSAGVGGGRRDTAQAEAAHVDAALADTALVDGTLCDTAPTDAALGDLAARVVARAREVGRTLACAESLTGGLLAATITTVPGASEVFRGGLVTYATDLKATLAGVDETDLRRFGAVSHSTAEQLARGAALRCGADLGIGLTGVAGPSEQEGHPAGTVFVGWFARDRGPSGGGARAGHRDPDAPVVGAAGDAGSAADPQAGLEGGARRLRLAGSRAEIRRAAVASGLQMWVQLLEGR